MNRIREVLTAPFTLPGNVVVVAGSYQYLRPRLELETAQSRRVSVRWTFTCCDYPGGRSTIHIESFGLTRNFSPEMKLVGELQYDNVSRQFGASFRYRWEIRPTTELLVTLGESASLFGRMPDGSYHSQATAVSVRLGHRFQN